MAKQKLYSDVDAAIAKEITRLRVEALEINQLLSRADLTSQDIKRLKELFLRDADDVEALTVEEWQEILKNRVVIASNEKQLVFLADKFCAA